MHWSLGFQLENIQNFKSKNALTGGYVPRKGAEICSDPMSRKSTVRHYSRRSTNQMQIELFVLVLYVSLYWLPGITTGRYFTMVPTTNTLEWASTRCIYIYIMRCARRVQQNSQLFQSSLLHRPLVNIVQDSSADCCTPRSRVNPLL